MNTFSQVLAQLDAIFTVQAGLVFSLVVVCVLVVLSLRKPAVVTHYMRTDMVDMVLSATEYTVFLKAGDIRGEWKPVINGKLLPVDADVLQAQAVAQAELADKDADYEEMCAAYAAEAEAHYANEIVSVVGYCECVVNGSYKPFHFTTTSDTAKDDKFLDMVACSHCPVCNPDYETMFAVDNSPALTVVSEVQEGERVTFTFNDGSTAVMRAYTYTGCTERQLDAPSEGGYRVDSIQQARAIDAFTGTDCIPF